MGDVGNYKIIPLDEGDEMYRKIKEMERRDEKALNREIYIVVGVAALMFCAAIGKSAHEGYKAQKQIEMKQEILYQKDSLKRSLDSLLIL